METLVDTEERPNRCYSGWLGHMWYQCCGCRVLEILANGKSEEAGVVICERKVVMDEFRGIGFGWVSVNGDVLADGRAGPTNNALASGQSSQSLDRDTPDIEPQGLQASVFGTRLATCGKHR